MLHFSPARKHMLSLPAGAGGAVCTSLAGSQEDLVRPQLGLFFSRITLGSSLQWVSLSFLICEAEPCQCLPSGVAVPSGEMTHRRLLAE